MDKAQLLSEFTSQIEALDRFQAFIEKAKDMGTKFRPEVVQKVIADNTEKRSAVVALIVPMVQQMAAELSNLNAQRSSVGSAVESARVELEELELRREIGELDEADFEAAATSAKGQIGDVDLRLLEIDTDAEALAAAIATWEAKRPEGAAAVSAPTPTLTPAPTAGDDLLGDLEDDAEGFEGLAERGDGVHAELRTGIVDDVSAVFEEDEPSVPSSDIAGISFGDEDLNDVGGVTVTAKVATAAAAVTTGVGVGVMVLGEGTPDEQVFGFDGEVISIGRGRDNTIQVKNDSKVSRYHCKVFKRDGQFFIDDNKSANGTLVDGELITEKRLVGGEEVIVGESFFRFRIRS